LGADWRAKRHADSQQRRKSAERSRQIVLAAAKIQACAKPAELKRSQMPLPVFAPEENFQPFGNDRAPGGQAP